MIALWHLLIYSLSLSLSLYIYIYIYIYSQSIRLQTWNYDKIIENVLWRYFPIPSR